MPKQFDLSFLAFEIQMLKVIDVVLILFIKNLHYVSFQI